MNQEIYRKIIPLYNDGPTNILAERQFSINRPLLSADQEDYTAVIEAATVDMSLVTLDPNPNYKIMIFCELKDTTTPPKPPGLEYGSNIFTFQGPLVNVDDFMFWINDVLIKEPLPFSLGLYELTEDDLLRYSADIDTAGWFANDYFSVYFNAPLARIMGQTHVDFSTTEQAGTPTELFYRMINPSGSGSRTSLSNTIYMVNKIKDILITTTLPITKTEMLNFKENTSVETPVIGSYGMNPYTYDVRRKSDWRYIPNPFVHFSLCGSGEITEATFHVVIGYQNANMVRHILAPGESFSIKLAFYPRSSVDEKI